MQAHRLEGPPGPTWHTCNLPPVSIAMHYQAAHNSAGMHVSAVYVFAWHARGSTTQHQAGKHGGWRRWYQRLRDVALAACRNPTLAVCHGF